MKKFFQNTLLLLFSTVLTLILAEILIRLLMPQNLTILDTNIWTPDSIYGWKHNPMVDVVVNTGEGDVKILTDNRGLRVSNNKIEDTCSKKGLVIGDSFLEALATDNDSIAPAYISRWYNTTYGRCLGFDNTAVSGYGPGQYYVVAKNYVAENDYDFGIVFLYTGNDFSESPDTVFSPHQVAAGKSDFRWPNKFTFKAIKNAWLYPINEALERKSHLFYFLKEKMKFLLMRVGLSAYGFPTTLLTNEKHYWSDVADYCVKIEEVFKADQAKVYFVLIPSVLQVNEEELFSYASAYKIDTSLVDPNLPEKAFGEEMRKRGLVLIDPVETIRERNKTVPQYGTIDTHLNAAGHKTVAETIIRELEKRTVQRALTNN